MTRPEKAVRFFLDGCNCSQSVVLAFSDELGIDAETLLKLAEWTDEKSASEGTDGENRQILKLLAEAQNELNNDDEN